MKKLDYVLISFLALGISACNGSGQSDAISPPHSSSSSDQSPSPISQVTSAKDESSRQGSPELKIGFDNGYNRVDGKQYAEMTKLPQDSNQFDWEWTAKSSSLLRFDLGAGAGCSDYQETHDFNDPFDPNFVVTNLKTQESTVVKLRYFKQQEGETYRVTLKVKSKKIECAHAGRDFVADEVPWSGDIPVDRTASPAVVSEPGFLGEETLDEKGGEIKIEGVTADSAYKDFIVLGDTISYSPLKIYKNIESSTSSCPTPPKVKLELLMITPDGNIAERTELKLGGAKPVMRQDRYYRLRFSVEGISKCTRVYESFNVGTLYPGQGGSW
jgi:hypothetical protein